MCVCVWVTKCKTHLLRFGLLHDDGPEQVLNIPRQLLTPPIILSGRIQSDKHAAMQIHRNLKVNGSSLRDLHLHHLP